MNYPVVFAPEAEEQVVALYRRRRQQQGIDKAKQEGQYKGRSIDADLHRRILSCLASGMSLRKTAETVGCALSTVQRAKAIGQATA